MLTSIQNISREYAFMRDFFSAGSVGIVLSLLGTLSQASEPGLGPALAAGSVNLDTRLRYENVDRGNPANDTADALTARVRLGYTTGSWNELKAVTEFEGVFDLSDQAYNSTRNGRTDRAVVADPRGTELNQAYLGYAGLPASTLKLGRQRLIYDNARFVGNVGWRQNEQTFDALSVHANPLDRLSFSYAYLTRVNGIVFNSSDLDGHLLNLSYSVSRALSLAAYAYALDYATGTADSQTIGLRATGKLDSALPLSYTLEYAVQSDYADALNTVDAAYLFASLGTRIGPVDASVNYEILGSNEGRYGLQTPLATKHAFQGWADLFLRTPDAGVRDAHLVLAGHVAGIKLKAIYHQFDADFGGADYGSEIDVLAVKALSKSTKLLLKFADYRAVSHGADTRKLWLMFNWKL